MPKVRVNGAELYYEVTDDRPETVVFAHGLLWSGRMFEAQVAALKDRYRCITFDFRGHGQSEVTPDGYHMDNLTNDVAALIETLHAAPCHFVGLSQGGFLGPRLTSNHRDLVRTLALIGTSADKEPWLKKLRYRYLAYNARYRGLESVLDAVMEVMFGAQFLAAHPKGDPLRQELERQLLANDRMGVFHATKAVLSRPAVVEEASRIRVPTLVVVGSGDNARPVADARRLNELIPGSTLDIIKGTGHTLPVEKPDALTQSLLNFWTQVPPGDVQAESPFPAKGPERDSP